MRIPKKDSHSLKHERTILRGTDQTSDKFVLRLPDGMRDAIAEMAERSGRSMNAEIVNALAAYIAQGDEPDRTTIKGLRGTLDDVQRELKRFTDAISPTNRARVQAFFDAARASEEAAEGQSKKKPTE
jgi:hypothetical protein